MDSITQDMLLSEYGRLSRVPSPVNRLMSSFARDFREGYDINLGVGYVDESTIPRALVREALEHVLDHPEKYKTALNYGGPEGSQNLIDSIRSYYLKFRIGGLTEELLRKQRILIGPNGATSLLEGIADVLEPGIVVTSDPMYYIYCHYLERRGFRVLAVPETEDGIDADAVADRLMELGDARKKISFLYVVSINNPTSTILSNAKRKRLVEIATELSVELGRTVPLFIDKAYEDLVHDPRVGSLQSGFLFDEAGSVYEIGTLSKILAPSLRIGYIMGKDGPFLRAMVQRTSDNGFSAPLINQEIAGYLLDRHVEGQIDRVCRAYREKAVKVKEWLDQNIGEFVSECRGGQAGFYYYLTFRDIRTGEKSPFFRYLTRSTGDEKIDGPDGSANPRVIYIPGEFCVHPEGRMVKEGQRQMRISYGFEETGRIKSAVLHMREAIEWIREKDSSAPLKRNTSPDRPGIINKSREYSIGKEETDNAKKRSAPQTAEG